MVPSIFLVTIVKQVAGAIAVAARVRGCRGGGGVRGLFLDLYGYLFAMSTLFGVL